MPRRKDPAGIEDEAFTVRPDRVMRQALDEDLAVLRERNPRATRADVIRWWARQAQRARLVKEMAELEARAASMERAALAFQQEAADLRRQLAGISARRDQAGAEAIQKAVRLLRHPNSDPQRQSVRHLAELEASGLEARSPNAILQAARAELGGWQALIQEAEGATPQ